MTSNILDFNEGGLFSNPEFSEARRVPHSRFFESNLNPEIVSQNGLYHTTLKSELEVNSIVYTMYGLTYNPYNIYYIYKISINLQRGTLLASQISGLENTPRPFESRNFYKNLDKVKAWMSNESLIFSATDSDNESSKSEIKTVDSPAELVRELESRGDLP